MKCITVSMESELLARMAKFRWVNWSEVGREEAAKREIFERFLETGKLTVEDMEFCDRIDWRPYDDLPIKESYLKKLEGIRKAPGSKMTLDSLDSLMGLK
jgi:hypothetical protein